MTTSWLRVFCFISFVILSAPGRAEIVVLARLGAYDMNDTRQGAYTVDEAEKVYAYEFEVRNEDNISIGGEIFAFSNDYASSATNPTLFGTALQASTGTLDSSVLTFNVKKYFAPTTWLLPFAGVGAGFATTALEPATSLTETAYLMFGFAVQAVAGAELRMGRVGIHAQARALSAKLKGETMNSAHEELDLSGVGYFGGLAVHF